MYLYLREWPEISARLPVSKTLCYTGIKIYQEISRMVMTVMREKFSSQADPKLLAKLRVIAENQGRQFQSVLEEALVEYLDRHQKQKPRTHVMDALGLSIEEYDVLYQKFAR